MGTTDRDAGRGTAGRASPAGRRAARPARAGGPATRTVQRIFTDRYVRELRRIAAG